jgi:hypothetical protein
VLVSDEAVPEQIYNSNDIDEYGKTMLKVCRVFVGFNKHHQEVLSERGFVVNKLTEETCTYWTISW